MTIDHPSGNAADNATVSAEAGSPLLHRSFMLSRVLAAPPGHVFSTGRAGAAGLGRPGWAATLWAAAATGSFVAGFVQGFVPFLSFHLDLGLPFGGFRAIGGAVAVGFWLFLLHLIVLVGYSLALRLDDRGGVPWAQASPARGAQPG